MICPCKGCTKRWVNETTRCHSSCTEYKEWRDSMKKQSDDIAKRKLESERIGKILYSHRRKR